MTPCRYPPCGQPVPPNPPTGGRTRRYCSKACCDRDYTRRHPKRSHSRTRPLLPTETPRRRRGSGDRDLTPAAIERRIAAAFAHIRRVGLPPRD